MQIRKNQPNPSQYHKFIRLTQYDQQSQTQSHISQENPHYRTFDTEDLVEKIKEQEGQIQKLLGIIDKYKSKIQEFQQYEEVIKEFLARKQQQKRDVQRKIGQKSLITSNISQSIKQPPLTSTKPNKQLIVPSYSITILCQNQKLKYQKVPSIKFQTPQKIPNLFQDIRPFKEQQKQNRQYRTNYKQKSGRQPFYRGSKSFVKSNSTFDINHSIPYLDESEFREEINRRSVIQRVPSLNNMRRIQKCFKLLKG